MKIQSSLQPDNPIRTCVIRLGDFHRSMSFLGAIGHLMEGSGLSSVVELIYPELTVPRILNGKEVSRATRAHFVIYETLMGLMLSKQLEKFEYIGSYPDFLKDFLEMVNLSFFDKVNVTDIKNSENFQKIIQQLSTFSYAQYQSKTSLSWLQYMKCIEIFIRFLEAERTSNWKLHLNVAHEMIPFFFASGHYLYAKSTFLYLQTMLNLETTHPDIYKLFEKGYTQYVVVIDYGLVYLQILLSNRF